MGWVVTSSVAPDSTAQIKRREADAENQEELHGNVGRNGTVKAGWFADAGN